MRWIPLILVALLASCSSERGQETDERGWPKKIRFAYTPDEENPGRREHMYRLRADYLSEQIGVEVEIVRTTQYGPVIEAMRAGKIEMSNLSTFPYLIASKKAGAEAIAAMSDLDGNPRQSYSLIIARADSELNSIEDVAERANAITFAFVNPASTSGHLIPRYFLEQQGLSPESDFKELVFPGKQNATILSVTSGKVDAAAISKSVLYKLIKHGSLKEGEVKVVWQSMPIPSSCVSVRGDLPEDLKEAIRRAHVDLAEVNPKLLEEIRQYYEQYRPEPVGSYIAIDDTLFDEMRVFSGKIQELAMLQ